MSEKFFWRDFYLVLNLVVSFATIASDVAESDNLLAHLRVFLYYVFCDQQWFEVGGNPIRSSKLRPE